MEPAQRVLFGLSLLLAVGMAAFYLWWGAVHGAFLDPGLLPTTIVIVLLGLLGAYATKLEAASA